MFADLWIVIVRLYALSSMLYGIRLAYSRDASDHTTIYTFVLVEERCGLLTSNKRPMVLQILILHN